MTTAAIFIALTASCTGESSEPLPHSVEELHATLPESAKVDVFDDLGLWGRVLVINDSSRDRMASDLQGETVLAVMAWLNNPEHLNRLEGDDLDHIFLCHAFVAIHDNGDRQTDIQVIPLTPDSPLTGSAILANQSINGIRRTTASC